MDNYKGFISLNVDDSLIEDLYLDNKILIPKITDDHIFYPNMYVELISLSNNKHTALGKIDETCKQIKRIDTKNLGSLKPKNREQVFAMDALQDKNISVVVLTGKTGSGKAQPLDAKVLTTNGWDQIGNLTTNSKIITPSGEIANVTKIFPQGIKPIYKIKFSDQTSTECCIDHLWLTQTCLDRQYHKSGTVKSLKEILETLKYGKYNKRNHSIPMVKHIDFEPKNLPLDPYVMGCILGDGDLRAKSIIISNKDEFIIEKIKSSLLEFNCELRFKPNSNCDWNTIFNGIDKHSFPQNSNCDWNIIFDGIDKHSFPQKIKGTNQETFEFEEYSSVKEASDIKKYSCSSLHKACSKNNIYKNLKWEYLSNSKPLSNNPIKKILIELECFGCKSEDKFIPYVYKYGSYQQRVELLQGLMDTDGTVDQNGHFVYLSTSSTRLRDDFKELVESLGCSAVVSVRKNPTYTYKSNKKIGKPNYRISFSPPSDLIPFQIDRKRNLFKPRTKYVPTRYIDSIEFIGNKEAACIMIDHPDHLYITNNYIVTHNTLISMGSALEQINKKIYKKVILSRPMSEVGKYKLGALPGPQPLDAKIATPNGWALMGDLSIGDYIITEDGTPAKVLNIYKKGIKDVFRVTTTDGTSTECCEDHLWYTRTAEEKKRGKDGCVRSLKEIVNTFYKNKTYGKHKYLYNHVLPRNKAVQYQSKDVPLDPYLVGVLLGNGYFGDSISLSSIDEELLNRVSDIIKNIGGELKQENYIHYDLTGRICENNKTARRIIATNLVSGEVTTYFSIGEAIKKTGISRSIMNRACENGKILDSVHYAFINADIRYTNIVKNAIHSLGLLNVKAPLKFVPELYKYNSIECRLELLRGLMDTNGTVKKTTGESAFCTVSKRLALDVIEIVRSLGGKATLCSRDRRTETHRKINGQIIKSNYISYEFTVSLPEEFNPFYISRKASFYRKKYIHHPWISSIEYVGQKEVQCILIDSANHLYLTDNFIVTHNTKDDKFSPYLSNYETNLEHLVGDKCSLQDLIEQNRFSIVPLQLIRGASFSNCFIIIDEAQILGSHEILTIGTRVGPNSKLVILGDFQQRDENIKKENTGMYKFVNNELAKMSPIVATIELQRCERSATAVLFSEIFDE